MLERRFCFGAVHMIFPVEQRRREMGKQKGKRKKVRKLERERKRRVALERE